MDALGEFADLLEAHIRKEERELFPLYEKTGERRSGGGSRACGQGSNRKCDAAEKSGVTQVGHFQEWHGYCKRIVSWYNERPCRGKLCDEVSQSTLTRQRGSD